MIRTATMACMTFVLIGLGVEYSTGDLQGGEPIAGIGR